MIAAQGIRLDRADRKEMIWIMLNESSSDWHTSHTIAKLIMMKPSQHLRDILNEMVDEGRLHCYKVYAPLANQRWDTRNVRAVYYALPHRDNRRDLWG